MILTFLIDYKNYFGSKYNAVPYNSGLDQPQICNYFKNKNVEVEFVSYNKVLLTKEFISNRIFIHDSIEDTNYRYKSYMEDVIFGLELFGANIIPGHKYIKAHNNKIFMELLKGLGHLNELKNLKFSHYGSLDEYLNENSGNGEFPVVIKGAEEAQGRQVKLGKNYSDTIEKIKEISRSPNLFRELWELGRSIKHKLYKKESKFRNKFILQQFVPNLRNDWKVLVFGDKYYILKRGVPENDFKASGSKFNYGFGSKSEAPNGIFDFAKKIYDSYPVPYISLDIAFDGKEFYLIEMQFVSFGSSTHLKSDCFYTLSRNNEWVSVNEFIELEELYCESILSCLKKSKLISE